ncbi:MAG: 6,7-dimethyl-8-ribityllumazine synthase [Elusimicrobiales bacterium]|jgi:6,7-dimethyl-8-ribityllumazine synthase|nr:6,7-dimethyl-8-ribityllumazine synthase [Elusimicrobiales bacterium]
MKIIEGKLKADKLKFALVVSRFNDFLTGKLADGAVDTLKRHGADEKDITLVKVPGAYELALAADKAASGAYHAVVCLGVIIRGDTPHFDLVASETAKGVAEVSMRHKKPVIFGVVAADSLEQAIERCGTKQGNKGSEAAMAAIEMADLFRNL